MADMQKAISRLVYKYMEDEDSAHLREMFLVFDADHDGVVTKQELENGLRIISMQNPEAEANRMIAQADLDADGVLNETEFVALMTQVLGEEAWQ